MNGKFILGNRVRDMVSGFQGLVTARAIHLNGCDRFWVQPPTDKDGKLVEGSWFDDSQLEFVDHGLAKPPVITQTAVSRPGGPPSRVK